MGYDFWTGVCEEHAINPDLTSNDMEIAASNQVFFEEVDGSRFVPRSVMIDLEPGVADSIQASAYGRVFNPENIVTGTNGAGNCWATGFYSEGAEIIDSVLERTRKLAEGCDSMEGFILTHSMGGGTGSGLGARVIKELRAEFHDRMIHTYSVFPSKSVSDVIVEPYNSTLSMSYLIEESDMNVVIDNEALFGIHER